MSLFSRRGPDTLETSPLPESPQEAEPLHLDQPPPNDLLRALAKQLRLERRQAADPEELAAVLEEEGYSDEILRGRYNLGGLFDTAEQLYALKIGPRRAASLIALSLPSRRWLWRGPLLLLIGGAALGSAHLLGLREALSALAAAGVAAWGTGLRLSWLRQVSQLAPQRLRPRLLWGTLAGGALGALATLLLGRASPETPALPSAVLGALLGGGYSAALISAGVLLALARWPLVVVVFGAAWVLASVLSSPALGGSGWGSMDWGVVLLLALVGAAVGAALWATQPSSAQQGSAQGGSVQWNPAQWGGRPADQAGGAPVQAAALPLPLGARWAELQNQFSGLSAWPLISYGWACALAFVALAWRVGSGVLVLPLLLFGALEWLSALMQARLRQLAQRHQDPSKLRRGALWPAFGAPLLLLLLSGLLGTALRWLGLISAETQPVHLWGAAVLSAALLQSTWLARQPHQWPRLAAMWLTGAGLLATSSVNWWVPLLLLTLTLTLLCDDALSDLSTYR
ncbi:hypothetical protein EHF33_01730 [Deinococcus psychrotolerans]|uniref:Uncharacterized protein n=1 Tax=Deinococcus psychrotolerans TaxID=2489213 RepID=A0A3G8Y9L3_9DEIO|nr:hypothetical protein [Deinococcus psychrotolerans]AZI41630.1 hypothetical protein EHF33_01730 [Deinococcus psychrotolerans]